MYAYTFHPNNCPNNALVSLLHISSTFRFSVQTSQPTIQLQQFHSYHNVSIDPNNVVNNNMLKGLKLLYVSIRILLCSLQSLSIKG